MIIDITMFHVLLRHENGNIITYPNNLMLQKGVTKVLSDTKPKGLDRRKRMLSKPVKLEKR